MFPSPHPTPIGLQKRSELKDSRQQRAQHASSTQQESQEEKVPFSSKDHQSMLRQSHKSSHSHKGHRKHHQRRTTSGYSKRLQERKHQRSTSLFQNKGDCRASSFFMLSSFSSFEYYHEPFLRLNFHFTHKKTTIPKGYIFVTLSNSFASSLKHFDC